MFAHKASWDYPKLLEVDSSHGQSSVVRSVSVGLGSKWISSNSSINFSWDNQILKCSSCFTQTPHWINSLYSNWPHLYCCWIRVMSPWCIGQCSPPPNMKSSTCPCIIDLTAPVSSWKIQQHGSVTNLRYPNCSKNIQTLRYQCRGACTNPYAAFVKSIGVSSATPNSAQISGTGLHHNSSSKFIPWRNAPETSPFASKNRFHAHIWKNNCRPAFEGVGADVCRCSYNGSW